MRVKTVDRSIQEALGKKLGICYVATDDVIEVIRKKYGIIIYNSAPPFVSPIKHKIVYSFSVKKCYELSGWNHREYIYRSPWQTNINKAKCMAIKAAIRWILSHKSQESKNIKVKKRDASKQSK